MPDITQDLHRNPYPLHLQILNILKTQISTGVLKPGDIIPAESQLCKQYNVSRTTVRLAMEQLVEDNLIIRRRGKGSFVTSPKLKRSLNYLYSFTEDMLAIGKTPSSVVVEKALVKATTEISRLLSLPIEANEVFKLKRVRMADGEPILLETTYIPSYLCNGIMEEDFSKTSLYGVMRSRYNLFLHRAIEAYEAVKMDKETSRLLQSSTSACGFKIRRTAYLDSGIAYELTQSITRSDKCIFKVELFGTKNKANFYREIDI